MVHYIYVGIIELTKENIRSILAAASDMEISSLVEKCVQYLEDNSDGENCVDTLMLTNKYDLIQLKKSALKLVCEEFGNLSPTDILKMDGKVFKELLECEQIDAPETEIFNRLVDWAPYKDNAILLPELLRSIRLDCLPAEVML